MPWCPCGGVRYWKVPARGSKMASAFWPMAPNQSRPWRSMAGRITSLSGRGKGYSRNVPTAVSAGMGVRPTRDACLNPTLLSALDTARWFAFLSEESEPHSRLGCDSDRRLHIWVNVAVIGKRSRCGEGEHESLVLGDVAGRIECSVIACHCMWGITRVGPHNLRTRLDRQCCRIKHVHIIFLDDLHLGHRGSCAGCSCSGWTWRRLRCSSRRGSRCCPPTPACS